VPANQELASPLDENEGEMPPLAVLRLIVKDSMFEITEYLL